MAYSDINFVSLINTNMFNFLKLKKKIMSEKTYVFDGGSSNGIISALAPMLQSKGIDPGVLALMNNNGGFGGNGGW